MSYNQTTYTRYGLDIPVDALKSKFINKLFSGKNYSSYGQAYNIAGKDIPYVYDDTNDKYIEVLFDDRKDAISFFYQNGEASRIEGSEYFNANVEILFALNLDAIEDDVSAVDVEQVCTKIYDIIRNNSIFEVTGRIIGLDAFSSFDTSKIFTKDMLPNLLIKFNTIINFKMN